MTDPRHGDEEFDFPTYDRCLEEGRKTYYAGGSIADNPYPKGSFAWESWREGYDR
jgi:hypothetical protein